MLFLFRRLKHDLLMKGSFRKYSAYAFGEMLLVVIGILVALQIDNWNEDRKQRDTLQSYLESIARNMREDLAELERLRDYRLEVRHAAAMYPYLRNRDRYEVDEIFFVSQVADLSMAETFFSANTSGFEALKSSGVLDRLQGSAAEHLMSDYYDTVNQIGLLESSLYGVVRPILIELMRDRPTDLEDFAIRNPSALPPERFEALQPAFSSLINSPMMGALAESQGANSQLMLHYDSLRVLGQAFDRAVESGELGSPEAELHTPFDDWVDGVGLPDIVRNGQPALEAYWLVGARPQDQQRFRFDSFRMRGDELRVDYPGNTDWASVYWQAINISEGRSNMDFSRFGGLRLELKGERGGEVLKVHVKDADYPDDLAPISVEVTLTDDWQTYDIDLAEFAPTDFARLHVVLGLLIHPARDPLSFSIRNAHYY